MKKLTSAVLVIVLIGLTRFAFAQTALPDLKVELSLSTDSFQSTKYEWYTGTSGQYRLVPGDVITIPVKVSNNGQASSGPFTVEISLDFYNGNKLTERYKVFTKKFADLKPGEEARFDQNIKIETSSGDIRCRVAVVAMEKDDWNDSDNSQSFGTIIYWEKRFVTDYLRPDLEIKLTSPQASRHITKTVHLEAVVTNKGNVASPATEIVLKCKEKDKKKQAVPPLKPGASFSHDFQHKWYTLGTKKCTARVDSSKEIEELDEWNNEAEESIYIK
ncbi:MAG: hypothetical protein OEW04_04165 [Nitrospirota bacterium]|nr:hypothetical protein [Nitrospirota bacterium]